MQSLKILSFEDLTRQFDEHRALQAQMSPHDPEHDCMFAYDDRLGYLDLYWGGYEYSIPLTDISTRGLFLSVLSHVLSKGWQHTTGPRVSRLIKAHSRRMRWGLFKKEAEYPAAPTSRQTSDTEERAKLTPKLRYDVLCRDNYRCRACGHGVEDGAHLHIDHIHPISRGGLTEFENLQALCSSCNYGKGARR